MNRKEWVILSALFITMIVAPFLWQGFIYPSLILLPLLVYNALLFSFVQWFPLSYQRTVTHSNKPSSRIQVTFPKLFPFLTMTWSEEWVSQQASFLKEAELLVTNRKSSLFLMPLNDLPRGYYQLKQAELRVDSILGWFTFKRRINEKATYYQYPIIQPTLPFNPQQAIADFTDFNRQRMSVGQAIGQEEFHGVREYSAGDALQHIHWKLSAKHQQLMTKSFEGEKQFVYRIRLDCNTSHYFEEKVSLFATVGSHLMEEGHQVIALLKGEEFELIKGLPRYGEWLQELARVEPEKESIEVTTDWLITAVDTPLSLPAERLIILGDSNRMQGSRRWVDYRALKGCRL